MKNGGKDSGWSPYGCHYYPDPSEFPDPKVSTLPNDPLSAGEQYYLDLAGNIKKVSRENLQNLVVMYHIPHIVKRDSAFHLFCHTSGSYQ